MEKVDEVVTDLGDESVRAGTEDVLIGGDAFVLFRCGVFGVETLEANVIGALAVSLGSARSALIAVFLKLAIAAGDRYRFGCA